jgi:hypothetical protein
MLPTWRIGKSCETSRDFEFAVILPDKDCAINREQCTP